MRCKAKDYNFYSMHSTVQKKNFLKIILWCIRSTAIVQRLIRIYAISTSMPEPANPLQRVNVLNRQREDRFFASHIVGFAVSVENVVRKNFSPFAYHETEDHKRACMNCESLLNLGNRPPYSCFPHPAQTEYRPSRTWSRSQQRHILYHVFFTFSLRLWQLTTLII